MFLIAFIFLVSFLLVLQIQRRNFAKTLPPGPTPWPLVGNLLQVDKSDPRKTFRKWYKAYGPVYTVWSGSEAQVFVCDYSIMYETFVKNGNAYIDRPPNWLFENLLKGKYGIVFASGDRWKEQRRFTLHSLRNFGFGRPIMEEKVLAETRQLLTTIDDALRQSSDNVINFDRHLETCIGNIISSVLVGRTYPRDDPTFRQLKSRLYEMFELLFTFKLVSLLYFAWLRFVPLFGHFGFDEFESKNRDILSIILNELARHKEEACNDGDEPKDFTAAYLQEIKRRTAAGEDLSFFCEWQLICVMYDLWVAGMETAVPTVRWALILMATHPNVQQKVQQEIDSVIGRDRYPTVADKQLMPYTQAVINEIQRYANIVPANFPRMSNRDTTINGHFVPKGVTVIPQISVSHNDESVFADADRFDPNHFLESDGCTLKKIDHFVPFSIGKRTCIGEGLARMELFLILTSILQRYRLSTPSDRPTPSLKPVVRFIMDPQPYDCFVEIRK